MAAFSQSDSNVARALYQESLTIGRELGEPWIMAHSLNGLVS